MLGFDDVASFESHAAPVLLLFSRYESSSFSCRAEESVWTALLMSNHTLHLMVFQQHGSDYCVADVDAAVDE